MSEFGFGFSEEQEWFRREVRRFAQKELKPGAAERAKKDEPYPREIFKKLVDAGVWGMNIDERYGGQGLTGFVNLGIATEEIARADFCAPAPHLPTVMAKMLERWGSEAVKSEWIPRIVKADALVALALTEPEAGSDAAAITTRARRDGDEYVINGQKTSITWAPVADAAILFAKTDPSAGARGVTSFLVPLSQPGVSVGELKDTGLRPRLRGFIYLDDVRIPAENRIGEEGNGFRQVMNTFDYIRACLGLQTLAAAQASLEEAGEYAKQRKAFGRPIAQFEGVSFLFAEHWTRIEAARLLCYRALWLRDQGLPHTKEAAMCKMWVPRLAFDAIHDAFRIYGHSAYSTELPIEQRMRDVMGQEIGDGTAEIMKMIIAREVLGRESLPY